MDIEGRGRRGSPEKGTKTPAEQIMPTKGKNKFKLWKKSRLSRKQKFSLKYITTTKKKYFFSVHKRKHNNIGN
jgi:hypothetical protein